MIYALLSLGYHANSPIIQHAMKGLLSFQYEADGKVHIQNSPSTVWDTALIGYALQEAGLSKHDIAVRHAAKYLLNLQHDRIRL